MTDPARTESIIPPPEIPVWDPLVRVFHWTLVVAFFAAWFVEDDFLTVHVWAGYVVGGLIALRIVWGVAGTRHARFVDFVCPPRAVWAYLIDLLRFRAKRHLGHSPAGGAMAIALLVALAATGWAGLETYAAEEDLGPLAAMRSGGGDFWEDIHEILANATMALVLLHIAGVVLASIVHRENLVRAMITGRKRPVDDTND